MASRGTSPACENLEDRALARSPVTEDDRLRARTDTLVGDRFDKILFKTASDIPLSGRRTEVKILEDAQRQCQPNHLASAHPGQTPYVLTKRDRCQVYAPAVRLLVVHQTFANATSNDLPTPVPQAGSPPPQRARPPRRRLT